MTEFCDHEQGWSEYDADDHPDLGGRTVHERCPAEDCGVLQHRWEDQPTLADFTGGETA